MDKIPVNIISGFLGSGKTTAIIRLLSEKISDEKWAVIINEFGKVSIDSQTIGESSEAGTIFEISGGCICCSAKGYFGENLGQIIKAGTYSRIIIEPSGLGGIEMVSEIVAANADLRLMKVICLVDLPGIENIRFHKLPVYRVQIEKADIIVFSKRDLLENVTKENELVEKFKTLYPGKRYYLNSVDKYFWSTLLEIDEAAKEMARFRMISPHDQQLTDDNFQSESYYFPADTIFSRVRLSQFFKNHPSVIRAKGHLLTEDGWVLLNVTLEGCNFEPCLAKGQNQLIIIRESLPSITIEKTEQEISSTIIPKEH